MLDCRPKSCPFISPTAESVIMAPQPSDGLSFSARDLLTRLVREDGAIRGKITSLMEPLWFHRGTGPEITVEIADVRELVQSGLIEFWKHAIQSEEELYRASPAGRESAGKNAVADAARSARPYESRKPLFRQKQGGT
jgi:hypothetical protein